MRLYRDGCMECGRQDSWWTAVRRAWHEWRHRNDPKPKPSGWSSYLENRLLEHYFGKRDADG